MSAPVNPNGPGSPGYTTPPAGERARALRAAFDGAIFAAEVERWAAAQPYTRPGDPRGLLLTRSQWEHYDELQAFWEKAEAKYGAFMPRSVAAVRAQGMTIR